MDAKARKLMAKYSLLPDVAEALIEAGLNCPAKIRAASQKELEAVPGIGNATAKRLKGKT